VTRIRATDGCDALPRGGIKNDDNVHGTSRPESLT